MGHMGHRSDYLCMVYSSVAVDGLSVDERKRWRWEINWVYFACCNLSYINMNWCCSVLFCSIFSYMSIFCSKLCTNIEHIWILPLYFLHCLFTDCDFVSLCSFYSAAFIILMSRMTVLNNGLLLSGPLYVLAVICWNVLLVDVLYAQSLCI